MSALKVRLVRSWAGRPERHRRTLTGLGLYKIDDERILPDTAAVQGMIQQVTHLVVCERIDGQHKPSARLKRSTQKAEASR
ncbi:MAG: 50S ribosomal protein L30 [Isosphaeraceae bacterium]